MTLGYLSLTPPQNTDDRQMILQQLKEESYRFLLQVLPLSLPVCLLLRIVTPVNSILRELELELTIL